MILPGLAPVAKAQNFYLGVSGSTMVYGWLTASTTTQGQSFTADSKGNNLGVFLRVGKKPYFQFGADWQWLQSDFDVKTDNDIRFTEDISVQNFDLSLKVGYNIVKKPMFKYQIHAGPFIGRSRIFSGRGIVFANDDLNNSQWGFVAGTGIQFTNLIIDLEYNYHFTYLFNSLILDGRSFDFRARQQLIMIKAGFMF